MEKKIFSMLAIILIGAALLLISIKAHSQEQYETLVVPARFFANIENKIDRLSSQIEKQVSMSAIQQQLDQILANQAEIKEEIKKVKIRVST